MKQSSDCIKVSILSLNKLLKKLPVLRLMTFVVTVALSLPVVYAQTQDAATKLRLAQALEQSGDFENAAVKYRELHAGEPVNYVYFDGLRRVLLQLKRYDEVIDVLTKRIGSGTGDVNLRSMLGAAYYQGGYEREAYEEWERVITTDPANSSLYRIVANTMIENRLLEKAVELFRRARIASKDQNLFTLDLAQLLSVTMDYAGATSEFIRWLQQNPTQLAYVQSRMAAFTGKEEARADAMRILSAEAKKSNDVNLHRLIGWMYLEGKQFVEAYEVFKTIDKHSNAQGVELYAFAERALNAQAYDVAARAFKSAIDLPIAQVRMPHAKFGYALCLKEEGALADTPLSTGQSPVPPGTPIPESQSRLKGAVDNFKLIIAEYPRSEFSSKSHYQIGTIMFQRYFDLDGALSAFENAGRELPTGNNIHFDIGLRIGEVHTAKGEIEKAELHFKKVHTAPTATPDQQDEAAYRLAELKYYSGNVKEAKEILEGISSNTKADYANDAMLLHAFLEENQKTDESALTMFGRADLLARQRKNTEAITLLQSVIAKYPQALLVDDALMKIAALQTRSRFFVEAVATYERLLKDFKESSIALDAARFNIAEIYDYQLKNPAAAITEYTRLLTEFPHSLKSTQARKRIRELRGDSL